MLPDEISSQTKMSQYSNASSISPDNSQWRGKLWKAKCDYMKRSLVTLGQGSQPSVTISQLPIKYLHALAS